MEVEPIIRNGKPQNTFCGTKVTEILFCFSIYQVDGYVTTYICFIAIITFSLKIYYVLTYLTNRLIPNRVNNSFYFTVMFNGLSWLMICTPSLDLEQFCSSCTPEPLPHHSSALNIYWKQIWDPINCFMNTLNQ